MFTCGATVAPSVAAEARRSVSVAAFLCMLDIMPNPSLSGAEQQSAASLAYAKIRA
jgi:hypothetical protein